MERIDAWICPGCGQWGRDPFGCHRLPEVDVADDRVCDGQPVRVNVGPLFRQMEAIRPA